LSGGHFALAKRGGEPGGAGANAVHVPTALLMLTLALRSLIWVDLPLDRRAPPEREPELEADAFE
jgi:hypothetical protein